jgi:hypothetical protein
LVSARFVAALGHSSFVLNPLATAMQLRVNINFGYVHIFLVPQENREFEGR